eukprot:gene2733-biopygen3005
MYIPGNGRASTVFAHAFSWLTHTIHDLDPLRSDFPTGTRVKMANNLLAHRTFLVLINSGGQLEMIRMKIRDYVITNSRIPCCMRNAHLYGSPNSGALGLLDLGVERDRSLLREVQKLSLGIGPGSTVELWRKLS